jgi:hypothetical protein
VAGSLKACVNEFTKLRAHSTFESVCPRAVTLSGAPQPGGSEEADIARGEAKYSCRGAQKACKACAKRMCEPWTAVSVQAFIQPSRSPTSSSPPRRQ